MRLKSPTNVFIFNGWLLNKFVNIFAIIYDPKGNNKIGFSKKVNYNRRDKKITHT